MCVYVCVCEHKFVQVTGIGIVDLFCGSHCAPSLDWNSLCTQVDPELPDPCLPLPLED